MKLLKRLLTKNETKIPLLYVTFDYKKFVENGKVGSCKANVHPVLRNDEKVKEMINELIDYVRNNHDMCDF